MPENAAYDLPAYRPAWWAKSGHLQTIYPSLFRTVEGVAYRRETIDTPDGDVLDLDWADAESAEGPRRLVVVSHGLEGSSERSYAKGMARAFTRRGWVVLAWNLRGCGGTPNKLFRSYHSGATEDLDTVVGHALAGGYEAVALVGFSLGGNVTLKHLGERGEGIDPRIVGAVVFSVPCDLTASSERLESRENRVYMRYFMRKLTAKTRAKAEQFPGRLDPEAVARMRTFRAFDGYYTAPAHGFDSAEDYWRRASSLPLLPAIRVPTLIANAQNDSFLAPSCYPHEAAAANPHLTLLTPRYGGHVGFMTAGKEYWSETVATLFLERAFAARHAASPSGSTA